MCGWTRPECTPTPSCSAADEHRDPVGRLRHRTVRAAPATPRWRPSKAILAGYLGLALALTALTALGARGADLRAHRLLTGRPIDGWFRWDSGWYALIATKGYGYHPGHQSEVAFFPVYPMLVRAVSAVVGDVVVAGWLVTVTAGVATVLLFDQWLRGRVEPAARHLAVAALMLYPYALFLYGAIYSDAVFLALVIAAFLLIERERWLLAGTIGALATACRPVGVALLVGLAVTILERHQGATVRRSVTRRTLAPRTLPRTVLGPLLALVLAAGGLLSWMLYLWWTVGDPLAFVHVQEAPGWGQAPGPRTWLKVAVVDHVRARDSGHLLVLLPQAVAVLGALALVPRVRSHLGWGYAAYTLTVLVIPLVGTKDFLGCGRYLLAAFPVFAVVGIELAAPRWRRHRAAVLTGSALALGGLGYLWGAGVLLS